jgi:hypothetical protein
MLREWIWVMTMVLSRREHMVMAMDLGVDMGQGEKGWIICSIFSISKNRSRCLVRS